MATSARRPSGVIISDADLEKQKQTLEQAEKDLESLEKRAKQLRLLQNHEFYSHQGPPAKAGPLAKRLPSAIRPKADHLGFSRSNNKKVTFDGGRRGTSRSKSPSALDDIDIRSLTPLGAQNKNRNSTPTKPAFVYTD